MGSSEMGIGGDCDGGDNGGVVEGSGGEVVEVKSGNVRKEIDSRVDELLWMGGRG